MLTLENITTQTIDLHDLMEVVVFILNTRDPYTFEHSWRVSALSELMVDHMDVPDSWKDVIHLAAHLHDIGKIGVPDGVLNKPEGLTSEEYEVMKTHPEKGYQIVSQIKHLEEISLYVRHHHERWDGCGYPLGLKGEEIPLGARVIAVADTFDAITSSRPYREGLSYTEAYRELERVSGSQLCPEVTKLFLSLKSKIPKTLQEVNSEIKERNLLKTVKIS